MTTVPKPPTSTGTAGRRLWSSVLVEYELEQHEIALLTEAVRTVDQLDDLAALVDRDGLLLDSPTGPRIHPAAVEARQARIALARLLAALRLPAGEEDEGQDERRPQRRSGVRGVYQPRGVA